MVREEKRFKKIINCIDKTTNTSKALYLPCHIPYPTYVFFSQRGYYYIPHSFFLFSFVTHRLPIPLYFTSSGSGID